MLHAEAWIERLATGDVESRERLLAAMERLGPDAWTVLTPLPNDLSLEMAGVMDASMVELDARWRAAIAPTLDRLGLPAPGPAGVPGTARTGHSDTFRWLHGELSSVPAPRPGGHLVTAVVPAPALDRRAGSSERRDRCRCGRRRPRVRSPTPRSR